MTEISNAGEMIEAAARRLRSEGASDTETEAEEAGYMIIIRAIVALTQSILRREWGRVKLGSLESYIER